MLIHKQVQYFPTSLMANKCLDVQGLIRLQ